MRVKRRERALGEKIRYISECGHQPQIVKHRIWIFFFSLKCDSLQRAVTEVTVWFLRDM